MPRPRNPLSNRNRNESFKGAELQRFVEREAQKLAKSKRAQPVREGREFDLGELRSIVKAPFTPAAAHSWSIDQIVSARDQQMTGRFRLPARLAESFGTDDALFTARGVRLAPVQSLSVKIEAGKGPKGDKQADEARRSSAPTASRSRARPSPRSARTSPITASRSAPSRGKRARTVRASTRS
jgi:hypothetical protein